MFGFLKTPPLLDEDIISWLFQTYAWALKNFDAEVFLKETVLVKPTNAYFGGEASSADGMAHLIFNRVKEYAGVRHWPCLLMEESAVTELSRPQITIRGPLRGENSLEQADDIAEKDRFIVLYNQFQLNDPEVLIASYAHTLAYYLGLMVAVPPPGGRDNLPHAAELLAVFMGFGVIMANSANTRKIRACGSCSGPAVERQNYLSAFDSCYALAIFTKLKGLNEKEVVSSVKKNLRPFLRKAIKDVADRETQYKQLACALPALS